MKTYTITKQAQKCGMFLYSFKDLRGLDHSCTEHYLFLKDDAEAAEWARVIAQDDEVSLKIIEI